MLYIRIALSHLKYFGLILEQTPENYKNHESIISTTRYYALTECSETFGPSFCIQVFGLYFPLDAEKNFLRFQKGWIFFFIGVHLDQIMQPFWNMLYVCTCIT